MSDGMRPVPMIPESHEDIRIDCDTQGLISLAMILVASGWDARARLCECNHPLTMDVHRKLALECVAAIKLAALSRQRKRARLDRMTSDADSTPILGLDGEPIDGT